MPPGELLGRWLGVSRAGYGTIDPVAETVTVERGWNAPGVVALDPTVRFRDFGDYVDDLKRGQIVVCNDAQSGRQDCSRSRSSDSG